jgi:cellulose synthase/poly-beta-1,6-N-acetylglucosamine synthase-like glycosyltransferase
LGEKTGGKSVNPDVSVVLTAHNAQDSIGECLLSIAESAKHTRLAVEVILVDDRSSDLTGHVARRLGLENLTILRIDKHNRQRMTARQAALDKGIRRARGKIIFITDADALVHQDWIPTFSRIMENQDIQAAAGFIYFRSSRKWLRNLQNMDSAVYFWISRLLNSLGLSSGVFFGNFVLRKSIYVRMGGFEKIGFALTEDLRFSQFLHKNGYKICYWSESLVSVAACPSLKALIKRTFRISAGRPSAFSLIIWLWILLLPLLFVLALWPGGVFLQLFVIRYILGVGLVSCAAVSLGAYNLLPLSLIYEWMTGVFGFWIQAKRLLRHKVEWGGVVYDR